MNYRRCSAFIRRELCTLIEGNIIQVLRVARSNDLLRVHANMRFPRASGILLHPTSLPGRFGIGDFGSEAFAFVDFLKNAGQKLWQVLPLNPTGYGDSPFQCFSAYAGNHLLISLEELKDRGILEAVDFHGQPDFSEDNVDFGRVIQWKIPLLKRAASRFLGSATGDERRAFDAFCNEQRVVAARLRSFYGMQRRTRRQRLEHLAQ